MIYFITARDLGRVKIGFSENPSKRLNKVRSDCPVRVELEHVMEGDTHVEHALHAAFSDHLIAGEWFALAPQIEQFMRALPKWVKPARVEFPVLNFCWLTFGCPANAFVRWLEAANVTKAEMARRLGYDPSNMHKLLKKTIRPTLDMAFRIEAETGGAIPASAWVQQEPSQGEAA